ncbi:hypothetical protein BJ138DRAFT_702542 [Hygrophoropsis aurantiaca]|uniref:Uncharacterized protein n=1 Tax=Hygrophoropsis aurantiaca TaxID=72124 RepID=A0ACB8AJA9_9AGAM|nr:hypothetical protein BJ138DRAFT_702542 [Hygrophoropsis aurantiaca]
MSSTNPFRSQNASPNPPAMAPAVTGASAPHNVSEHDDSMGLDEEMPPAYTPSADIYQGESTVELGPSRPFQPPPRPPPNNAYASSNGNGRSGSQQTQHWPPPQGRGSNNGSGYLSQSVSSSSRAYGSSTPPWGGNRTMVRAPGGLIGTLFETVRDVVDAVSGSDSHTQAMQQSARSAYASPSSQYTHQRAASSPSASPSQSSHPRNDIPDDGSPTRTPVPGHPLLKDGMLLVYPNQYLCVKCRNTGYKNHDPSHPCRKCWEKYGKPYVGALTYTPWSSTSTPNSRLQRALPSFTPPQLSTPASRGYSPQPGAPSPYAPSQSFISSSYPPPLGNSGPHYYVRNTVVGLGLQPPVPGAIPVKPGDSCLGGRVCWRCGGTGMLPLFIIDVKACTTCGGLGRILR